MPEISRRTIGTVPELVEDQQGGGRAREKAGAPSPTSHRWYSHALWSFGSDQIACLTSSNSARLDG